MKNQYKSFLIVVAFCISTCFFCVGITADRQTSSEVKKVVPLSRLIEDVGTALWSKGIEYWFMKVNNCNTYHDPNLVIYSDFADIGIDNSRVNDFIALKGSLETLGYSIADCYFGYRISQNPKNGNGGQIPYINIFCGQNSYGTAYPCKYLWEFSIDNVCETTYSSYESYIDVCALFRGLPRKNSYDYNKLWRSLQKVQPKEEKAMVIIVPSYNNKDWYERNLDSIFMQSYNNFRVIYIDDASTDGTGDLVKKYITKNGWHKKFLLIQNTKNRRALANIYDAVYLCNDDEVVMVLDGDDWFAHENVLSLLNKVYEDPNIWLTYGQYQKYPSGEIGVCRQVPRYVVRENLYRRYQWITSQLRTFYAWLFKKIKKEDLLENGEFFPVIYDLAMMFPMLEMAGWHIQFIPDVLYIYNRVTPLNDNKVHQDITRKYVNIIRKKKRYEPLMERH